MRITVLYHTKKKINRNIILLNFCVCYVRHHLLMKATVELFHYNSRVNILQKHDLSSLKQLYYKFHKVETL